MTQVPQFTVLVRRKATDTQFVEFWSSLCDDQRDHLYSRNIGKPLTSSRLLELFEWKNGGTIAKPKLESIHRNYIDKEPKAPALGHREAHIRFIVASGGAIWRIFGLHCYDHQHYPIFDQHVSRAMKHLLIGTLGELPDTPRQKATAYLDEYLPFFTGFTHPSKKGIDEALWTYGKYLKRYAIEFHSEKDNDE